MFISFHFISSSFILKKWVSVESLIELRKSKNHIYVLTMLDELLNSDERLQGD
jgi:type III secretory pathway component EscU